MFRYFHYIRFSKEPKGTAPKPLLALMILFLIHSLASTTLRSQTEIGGVINSYSAVDSIISNNSIAVRDPQLFMAGDTVLLLQMKGISVIIDQPENYGRNQDRNNAGHYEFLLVDQIDGDTIIFTRNLLYQYKTIETVQLVKARGFENARVTVTLEAAQWDGEKGGVIALIVTDTLVLEADIDASGKGFRGGVPTDIPAEVCSGNDPEYQNFSYPEGSVFAGRKGEGPATYYKSGPDNLLLGAGFAKGRGSIASAGGGGNGLYSGGGGGSNFSKGGFGGRESGICPSPPIDLEAAGGYQLADIYFTPEGESSNILFFGGGGGSSTQSGERAASHGGSGGGIVIIVASQILGNDQYGIFADGDPANVATAGAGGGGGGGTIAISVDKYLGTINLHANGGKGGNVDHPEIAGPGGGGGEGVIVHSREELPSEVVTFLTVGAAGTNLGSGANHGATPGSPVPGEPGVPRKGIVPGLEISFNGLLFNNIKTTRHVICQGTAPDSLIGTNPRGGESPYTYRWFQKTGSADWTEIPGANQIHYRPGPLNETTQFTRVITDQGIPAVTDTSMPVTISVQPAITGNTIDPEQEICQGEKPQTIEGSAPTGGGTGIFEYKWLQSEVPFSGWLDATDTNNNIDYSPSELSNSTIYARVALSGVCADTSVTQVNVHPLITNNDLDPDQTICHGSIPLEIGAPSAPGGGLGAGTYTYNWEVSVSGTWNPVDENGNGFSYLPGPMTDTTGYRRIVNSGECSDTSGLHTINVLDLISGNTISDDQIICFQASPGLFTGTVPEGGDGAYAFLWESSLNSAAWAAAADDSNESGYQAPGLSKETYFRRIVFSGPDDACKDTSNLLFVELYSPSYAGLAATSDTICSGEQSPLTFNLRGSGPWDLVYAGGSQEFSITGINTPVYVTPVSPQASDSATYSYQILSMTDGNDCPAIADSLEGTAFIRVYAFPQPNAGSGGEACGLSFGLNALPDLGKGIWQSLSANASFSPGAGSANAVSSVTEYGTHEFRWTETNWQCSAGETIQVTFYEQVSEAFAGADQNLRYTFVTDLAAELPPGISTAYGEWSIIEGSGSFSSPGDPGASISNMDLGRNVFEWTVYNGTCLPVADRVVINIDDLNTPSAFSPNNSGVNDRFIISGIENSEYNELTVFNRQGNVVFKAVNYRNDWDGRNQNGIPLPEDTYYYILNVDNKNRYQGFIVLKR